MIVSERSGFVFVHNPKCGGSVFRRAIEAHHDHPRTFWTPQPAPFFGIEMDHAHLRLWEVQALHPDVFRRLRFEPSVVFVRNPLDRFVSALHHHLRFYRPELGLDELDGPGRLALMQGFDRDELTPERILTDYRLVHFSPQTWFCCVGPERIVGTIIPMGPGLNPMRAAADALGIALPTEDWQAPGEDRGRYLADPALQAVADRLYAGDHAFLGTLPHLREIL